MTQKAILSEDIRQAGDRLVNEAIKRILLDIVVRGHGDRLIGRWSREPELQHFLEQVPYMLDRINQLHLACTRCDAERKLELHHAHHYHHHHQDTLLSSSQSSLSDFMNLIGPDRHWLVRTRDPLGLTPLHKAVLFNNRPVVEYILDRYPDELAASGGVQQQCATSSDNRKTAYGRNQGATRLINAQDKYGRTALHYAAAQLSEHRRDSEPRTGTAGSTARHLYHFLVAKGASLMLRDFRGKTPAHYVRHPNQLRAKSVIHLSNKLNANYQANVLSKTLRANSEKAPIGGHLSEEPDREFRSLNDGWHLETSEDVNEIQQLASCNRESMSLSCNDLTNFAPANNKLDNSSSEQRHQHETHNLTSNQQQLDRRRSQSTMINSSNDYAVRLCTNQRGEVGVNETRETQDRCEQVVSRSVQSEQAPTSSDNQHQNQQPMTGESRSLSPISQGSSCSNSIDEARVSGSLTSNKTATRSKTIEQDRSPIVSLKELIGDRWINGMVIDQRTKQIIKRALNDGVIDRINELLADGYGNYLLSEAPTSCWNQQCRRYINQVIPTLLVKLDHLHELIVLNQLTAVKTLLKKDPILARIRRPYKRAAMGALHVAAWCDRGSMIRYLVDRFPELVAQRDSHGATCLHWAAKCLRHDRLYCWLLERFGHTELKEVRDWRGKSAFDYLQQAVRLSNFADNHPQANSASRQSMEVRDILLSNQRASDRLQLRGNKANMMSRTRQPVPLNTTQTTTRVESKTAETPILRGSSSSLPTAGGSSGRCSAETGDLDKSIEMGIELDSIRDEGSKQEKSRALSSAASGKTAAHRIIPNPESSTDTPTGAAHVTFVQQEDQVNTEQDYQPDKPTTKLPGLSAGSSLARESFNHDLLGEMVQLDSNELQTDNREDTIRAAPSEGGSPPITPSLPLSRPQSASSSTTLEAMIESSILNDDFKKLEHLILAGCGDRLLRFHNSKRKASAEETHSSESRKIAEVSPKMKEFCELRAPEYIEKIVQIHRALHRCFAKLVGGSHLDTRLDANNRFHKLCNLLVRRRLIVSRDSYGASPLHVALMRADRRLVDYLLRRHPEAASAPDHDRRNSIHYAAIVLAVYEAHGSFKLTTISGETDEADSQHLSGFWRVDENVEVMYGNLLDRYGELLELKDRKGLTASDYLIKSANLTMEHVSLDELGDGYVPASSLASCCPEYAQMLARYNYVITNEGSSKGSVKRATVTEDDVEQKHQIQEQPPARTSGGIAPEVATKSKRIAKRTESCQQTPADYPRGLGAAKSGKQGVVSARAKTADNLVRQIDTKVPVPEPSLPLEAIVVRQVAPKPTVGSESGYPVLAGTQSPAYSGKMCDPDLVELLGDQLGASTPRSSASRRHHNRGSLFDDFDPNHRASQHHKRHRHHRHHRNRHHHHHHKRKSASPVVQSIVGGVIVPTIIHNDKMDEIETYDIIYRRPPAVAQKQTSVSATTSSFSSESSCSLSLTSEDSADSDDGAVSRANSRLAAGKPLPAAPGKASTTSGHLHGGASGQLTSSLIATGSGLSVSALASPNLSGSSSSSEGDEDDEDEDAKDDEDDERVERLSNEFENRVRKEKSELRAKVDQIMNEIKLSAKSGKSSRFLASPSDFASKANPANDSVVLFSATNGKQNAEIHRAKGEADGTDANQTKGETCSRRQSMESHSSGHCSERTYETSVTSSASSSTSSRSSHNCGTASCSLGSLSVSSSKKASTGGSCSSVGSSSSVLNTSSIRASKVSGLTQTRMAPETCNTIVERVPTTTSKPDAATAVRNARDSAIKSAVSTTISELTGQLVSKNTYGQTYLHFIASRSQSASTLYKVLDHGSHLIGERDIFYRTARDVAVQFHLANNVQVLDKYIIDLFVGANTSLLRHLLNQGYSPLIHVSDTDGNDIMLILKLLKLDRMIHFLLQMADFQRWRDELHTFIRNGYSAGLTELIRKHADLVRAKSVHARTALHLAVLFDRPDMVGELIERDPTCVHSTDNMGRTALHYTYGLNLKNVEEIRELLLKNGASLDARDVKMRTPKYYFIFKREIEEIKRIELEFN